MTDALFVFIAGTEVPLSYYDMDPQTLRAIKKYPAFAEWASSFKKTNEFAITAVNIQNVEWIGKRIDGVTASVEMQSSSGQKLTQTMSTPEATVTALVLPVVQSEEGHFLLNELPSLANIGTRCYAGLRGTISAAKEVVLDDAAVLEGLGFTPTAADITPLSSKTYRCNTEGSSEMVRFFVWNISQLPATSSLPLAHHNGTLFLTTQSAVLDPPSKKTIPLSIVDANTVLALSLWRKMQQA